MMVIVDVIAKFIKSFLTVAVEVAPHGVPVHVARSDNSGFLAESTEAVAFTVMKSIVPPPLVLPQPDKQTIADSTTASDPNVLKNIKPPGN